MTLTLVKRFIHGTIQSLGWELRRRIPREQRWKSEYERQQLELWQCLGCYAPSCILDVGANEGQFAKLARRLFPTTPIVSFEPLAECFFKLQSQSAELAPFHPINSALGSVSGLSTINRSFSSPSSSFLPMGELHKQELPHTASASQEQVQISVLDEMRDTLPAPPPFLMKIDVQGFELEVLKGSIRTLEQTLAVIVEVSARPLYDGEPGFDAVFEFMQRQGFCYVGNVDQWRSRGNGQILQFDCLFENRKLVS
jgi:FkbM family methyltransferase